jgi:hypothetical protein
MANACGVTTAAGLSPEDHEVIPIGMSVLVVSTPTPLSANCCVRTIKPKFGW